MVDLSKRHVRALERRIAHLGDRTRRTRGDGALAYDLAELSMLHVARELFRLHLAQQHGNAYTTAFLLEEAAAHLEQNNPTLRVEELVVELRTRARLLAELDEPAQGDPCATR